MRRRAWSPAARASDSTRANHTARENEQLNQRGRLAAGVASEAHDLVDFRAEFAGVEHAIFDHQLQRLKRNGWNVDWKRANRSSARSFLGRLEDELDCKKVKTSRKSWDMTEWLPVPWIWLRLLTRMRAAASNMLQWPSWPQACILPACFDL